MTQGPFDDHLPQDWQKGRELIEVRWLPVLNVGGLHEMLIYTSSSGEQFVIAGFPKDDFDLTLHVGTLVMQIGSFNPTAEFTEDLSGDSRRQVIASASDLADAWAKMRRVAEIIDKAGIDYDLAGPNSNSAAETILKYTGVPSVHEQMTGDIGASFDLLKTGGRPADCDDANQHVEQVLK